MGRLRRGSGGDRARVKGRLKRAEERTERRLENVGSKETERVENVERDGIKERINNGEEKERETPKRRRVR